MHRAMRLIQFSQTRGVFLHRRPYFAAILPARGEAPALVHSQKPKILGYPAVAIVQ